MKNNLILRPFFVAVLIIANAAGLYAQQQSAPQVTANAEKLRQYISYLASDALEGRRTGSAGANDAAHYIAGEFSRLGLRPAIQAGRANRPSQMMSKYLQTFPYIAGVELGKSNQLSAKSSESGLATLTVREDWMPLGISTNAHLESMATAFVGYGITASELNYNDYASVKAEGKIAIALPGTPDGDNPHGQFGRYEDVRWKAIAARNAGARALVIIAREENFKEERLARLHYDNSGGDAGLPVVVLSKQAFQRIYKGPTGWLDEIEHAAKNMMLTSVTFKDTSLSLTTEVVRQEVAAANVIGVLEGTDPTLKNEAIVIGAHYDHLGRGGEGSLAPREGEIHHGADDNASGVAGALELARILNAQRPRPHHTIVFIAFSGEEEGLLGSNYYVNHPVMPLAKTVAMINMDMIGRMKNNQLIIGGVGTAQEWRSLIATENQTRDMIVTAAAITARAGTSVGSNATSGGNTNRMVVGSEPNKQFQLTLNEDGYGPSDHSSFYAKQVPVLFFWTGTHQDYHKPSDTADKINYQDEARILGLIASIIRDVDTTSRHLTYTVAKTDATPRATGFRVYLGTIPNYADANDGLLLDGVRDDSPAAKAGIKAGDKIVKLAGNEVHNVYDYTYALGEMKAGEEYEVELLRGGERLKLKITPAARK